jgi:hypothetical protein
MPTSVFKCPTLGFQIQASFPEPPENVTAESVQCIACDQVHLVNTKTGQLFGDEED